jgi:hypothetical protein
METDNSPKENFINQYKLKAQLTTSQQSNDLSGLSFWLVQNHSVSKKDSCQAGMTNKTKPLYLVEADRVIF